MTGFLLRGKPTVVYALSPGITMRLAIPAYSYRHGLNFILGIVKTRIGCSSGITYPSLIVMGQGHRNLLLGKPDTKCQKEIKKRIVMEKKRLPKERSY